MMMNQWSSFSDFQTHSQPMNSSMLVVPTTKASRLPISYWLHTRMRGLRKDLLMPFVIVFWLTDPVTGLISSTTAMGATGSACQKRWLECFHLSNAISKWHAICAGSACVQHALARPDSQFPCCTHAYFLRNLLWPEVQSHSDHSHVHATGPRALTQARPTMSCIYLVQEAKNFLRKTKRI